MTLQRSPLVLLEMDSRRQTALRALQANPGDAALRERAARASEHAGDRLGGIRIRHETAIKHYIGSVRKKNDQHQNIDAAEMAGQPGGIVAELRNRHREASEESEKSRLGLFKHLAPKKQHPAAYLRARLMRQHVGNVIDRDHFPEGHKGDAAHHEVLADLHGYRPRGHRGRRAGRTFLNTASETNPTRHSKHQDFQSSLAHHGYLDTHDVTAAPNSAWVRVERKPAAR